MNTAGGARGGTGTDEDWPIKTASLAAAMAHSLALVKKKKKAAASGEPANSSSGFYWASMEQGNEPEFRSLRDQ